MEVVDYFKKKIEIKHDKFILPKEIYTAKKWNLSLFQFKKAELNDVKGKLSEFDLEAWSKHTRSRDPSSCIISKLRKEFEIELVTQAWCKFYECLCQFKLIPKEAECQNSLISVHICEAPGAFICALNHYLYCNYPNIKWQWLGNTLNPNYEGNSPSQMISDDRLIQSTRVNWCFGADCSGDITKFYNHNAFVNAAEEKGKILLITADGSINCMDNPGEQESIVEHLHYCETMTALKILSTGGNFVLKIFTMFEDSTLCLLYLLKCVFQNVHLFKPATSKSGNSEVYVICLKYIGKDDILNMWEVLSQPYRLGQNGTSMFAKSDLHEEFLKEIFTCADFFTKSQIKTIEENIRTFKQKSSFNKNQKLKDSVTNYFFNVYPIRSIPFYRRIVNNINVSISCSKRKVTGEIYSYSDYDMICVNDLLDLKSLKTFMLIQTGKVIENILQSKFCSTENFDVLKNLYLNPSKIYEKFYQTTMLETYKNLEVINMCNFKCKNEFNKNIFHVVKNKVESSNKNIIFVGIPFLTTYLVGLLFILAIGYKKVLFYKNGVICLDEVCPFKLNDVKKCLDDINEMYIKISNEYNNNFTPDVVQVVDPIYIEQTHFYEAICNYNNNIVKNI